MTIKTFEDVVAWRKSKDLYVELYAELLTSNNYSYKDQLLRATLSISNNIAEGFDRGSDKELKQFLIVARGSAAEVRSMLLVGKELEIVSNCDKKLTDIKDISKLLTGFINAINRKTAKEYNDR